MVWGGSDVLSCQDHENIKISSGLFSDSIMNKVLETEKIYFKTFLI